MNKQLIIAAFALALYSCKTEDVVTADVISAVQFDKSVIDADASSTVVVSAIVNKDADKELRTVRFKTSAGAFVDGGTDQVTKKAEFEGGQLIAKATLRAPASPGLVEVKAEMDIPDFPKDYIASAQLQAVESVPYKLTLTANAFSVMSGFASEIALSARVTNAKGANASKGHTIRFQDKYANSSPVGGRFREVSPTTDAASMAKAIYSPGTITPNVTIYLKAFIDEPGYRNIADSVQIFVRPPQ